MRRVNGVTPVRLRRTVPTGELYGPTHGDLLRYISAKFAINQQDAGRIVRAVFDYIREEVLTFGTCVRINGFGQFRREYIDYARNRQLYTPGPKKAYLRFSEGTAARRPVYDWDEELEDAGPSEE